MVKLPKLMYIAKAVLRSGPSVPIPSSFHRTLTKNICANAPVFVRLGTTFCFARNEMLVRNAKGSWFYRVTTSCRAKPYAHSRLPLRGCGGSPFFAASSKSELAAI